MIRLLVLSTCIALSAVIRAEESFVLPAEWRIEIPDNPSPAERFAAEELDRYLAELPGDGGGGIYSIHVSARGVDLPAGETPDARAGEDVYRVEISPEGARLTGVNDRAALYAVYDFLESFGHRWLMPGSLGEIPASTRTLAPADRIERPAFFIREICTSGGESWSDRETVDWQVKNRLNRDFNLRRESAWEERGGTPLWHWIAHNYGFVLPVEEGWFEKHPEWFALYNGRRIPLGNEQGNVCTTNPELIAHFVDTIRDWFDNNPDGSVFPLSPPDGAIRWCEDEACLVLGGRNFTPGADGCMSLRQIRFVKEIAGETAKTHPDRKILLLAYQNYVDPVPGEKLPDNVLVQVVNYGAFGQPMTSDLNRVQRERFEGWAAITAKGSLGVWDYCLLQSDGRSGSRLMPVPVASALRDNLRFIHDLGGRIFFTQAGPLQESNPFVFYAAARWAWDPSIALEELLTEFCRAFYGAAAEPMTAYWLLLEEAARKSEWNPAVWPAITTPDARLFSPEVLAKAAELLQAASAAARTDAEKARIALIHRSLDYAKAAVGQAKPWRVERGTEFYRINADGGTEAWKQVKGLETELRNSADPDGSLGRLIFRLRPREAPVRVLENATASAAVIPELGGRVVRFADVQTGWNFFDEPEEDLLMDNPGVPYIHYGGYEEYAGAAFAAPGWETPFREGRGNADGIKMVGRIGDTEITRRVGLDAEEPLLRIESELRSPSGETVLRGHPVLRMPDGLEDLLLVWKEPTGTFRRQALLDSAPREVDGTWGVYSPRLQALLLHRFDPAQALHHLHVDPKQNTFNLELISHPGSPARLTQEFQILRKNPGWELHQLDL